MLREIVERLKPITEEEKEILKKRSESAGSAGTGIASADLVRRDLYTSGTNFVIDSAKLLEKGQLIDIRANTRFTYFPEHEHNYVEMTYILSGTLTTRINGNTSLKLTAGDLLLLTPRARHDILPCGEDDIAINFIILPEFFRQPAFIVEQANMQSSFILNTLTDPDSPDDFILFHTGGSIPIENLMENLLWMLIFKKHGINNITQSTVGLLFMNLAYFSGELRSAAAGDRQKTVMTVLEYIDQNYRTATLTEIAEKTGYSTYYLSRLLKAGTGSNFKQLLQQKRFQQTIYCLENTTMSADAIMERIGYDNSTYFYRQFSLKYGCTPKEYRKAHSVLGI